MASEIVSSAIKFPKKERVMVFPEVIPMKKGTKKGGVYATME